MDEDSSADPATDYSLMASLNKLGVLRGIQASGILEAASIRHCLFGDAVAQMVGSDVLIGHTILVVCDSQHNEAGSRLTSTGIFSDAVCPDFRTTNSSDYFPSFCFVTKEINVETNPCRIFVLPASYLHMNLDAEHYAQTTVFLAHSQCRFPNKLCYIDALVSALVERTRHPADWNGSITLYLKRQLYDFLLHTSKSLIARLPPEDILLIELLRTTFMTPSARVKMCVEWQKIRNGETTVEEARKHIPRRDLAFAKFKAEYQARVKLAEQEEKIEVLSHEISSAPLQPRSGCGVV